VTESPYIVGIDLGTTNSIVAYTRAHADPSGIQVFNVPQLIAPGEVETRDSLPSFLWIPGSHHAGRDQLQLPWGEPDPFVTGEFAKTRGSEMPERLISSAKSWLCHDLVDRNKPILPWGAPDDVDKLSPVEASARLLAHIKDAWNFEMARSDDTLRLENQQVYLTVPASFDAVARELTVKAAETAGLQKVTLLEEPQAAFYAWIASSDEGWRNAVKKDDVILVCDVGGGTSDFSLIRVGEENGNLILERIAVGDHLLVGGDNMDLALAYEVSRQLAEKGNSLNTWQIQGLCHTCRKAKEMLFSNADADTYPVTVLGRGSSLIGSTLRAELTRNAITQSIVDGFFPRSDAADMPVSVARSGLQELGLAYESDPAITRHLAKFLLSQDGRGHHHRFPDAILFNGGVMKADPIRKRVLETVSDWKNSEPQVSTELREIPTNDYDLSVACGAAYYGLARLGKGVRIRSGLGKSYYMGIAASMPAIPGMPPPMKALCVAPFGMEEGTELVLKNREFVLIVGEPVKFDILSASSRQDDAVGDMIDHWDPEEIEALTSIETTLKGDRGQTVPVFFEVKTTEVGTLEFWCVSKETGERWKLEFNVREKA
jgi:hypothetical protein